MSGDATRASVREISWQGLEIRRVPCPAEVAGQGLGNMEYTSETGSFYYYGLIQREVSEAEVLLRDE